MPGPATPARFPWLAWSPQRWAEYRRHQQDYLDRHPDAPGRRIIEANVRMADAHLA